MTSEKSPLLPVGALLITMLSVQGGSSLAKELFASVGAEGTSALRLGIAAILMTIVLRPWRARLTARNWQPVALYGVIVGTMNLLFYMTLDRLPLGITVALEFTGPLTVAICASRRKSDIAWIVLATIGLLLLLPLGSGAKALDPVGIALGLTSGACWGLYVIVGPKAGALHGAATPALGMIIAACITFPIGLAHAGLGLFAPAILPAAIGVAILSSALPFTLEMMALQRLSKQTYGTLTSLEPAIGALSGLVILHEALSPRQWLAIALIIIASIGTTLTMKAKAASPA